MTKEELDKKFEESIRLARECGVPEEKIIHNKEEIDKFFERRDSAE